MTQITLISCSLNPASRSRIMCEQAAVELADRGASVEQIDLREVEMPFCDGATSKVPEAVVQTIAESDAILLAVPIYNFDVNAAAKNLIEITGRNWTGKTVGFMCAAGGQGSYMSVMGLANSLMLDFRCLIVPRFVYATGQAFDEGEVVDEKVKARITELCEETLHISRALNQDNALSG